MLSHEKRFPAFEVCQVAQVYHQLILVNVILVFFFFFYIEVVLVVGVSSEGVSEGPIPCPLLSPLFSFSIRFWQKICQIIG